MRRVTIYGIIYSLKNKNNKREKEKSDETDKNVHNRQGGGSLAVSPRGRIVMFRAAVCVMAMATALFADETIDADTQLAADRKVSGALYLADGATLDLNGHNLTANAIAVIDNDDVPGYKFLEYISSTGSQWLYSNYVPSYSDKVVMKVNFTSMVTGSDWIGLFCSRGASNDRPYMVAIQGGTKFRVDHLASGVMPAGKYISCTFGTGTDYTISVDGATRAWSVNGDLGTWTETAATGWEATGPFSILGCHTAGADLGRDSRVTLLPSCKLYSFQVFDENGVVKCDMVPAIRTADNAIGMYDRAFGREMFIENYGSKAFIAGPRTTAATITNASAAISRLCINVPADVVLTNANITVSGNVRLVKDGDGSYFVTRTGQTYTAGTDIDAGTVLVDGRGTDALLGKAGGNLVKNGDFEAEGTVVPKNSNKDWNYASAAGFVCPEWTMSNQSYMGLSGPKTGIWISDREQINNLMGAYGFFMKTWGSKSGDLALEQGGLTLSRGRYRIAYNYTTRANANHAPATHVVNLVHDGIATKIGEATVLYDEFKQYKSAEWFFEIGEGDEGVYTLQFLQTIADNGSAERTTVLDNIVVEKLAAEVVVESGAMMEMASGARDFTDCRFTMNGGTLKDNSGAGGSNALVANMRLTADSYWENTSGGGFVGRDSADTLLDLGGYTLEVLSENSQELNFKNTTITNGTMIVPEHLFLNFSGDCVTATNATLDVQSLLRLNAPVLVGDYIARRNNAANADKLRIYGTLSVASCSNYHCSTMYCTMMDGSAVDFSQATAAVSGLQFAENATVTIKLGDSHLSNPIIPWTTAPENINTVTFVRDASEKGYKLEVRSDGLYAVRKGFMLIVK